MKILLISHTFLPKYVGGTEVYTFELAQELIKQGHTVEILCTDPLSSKENYEIDRSNYQGLKINTIQKNILKYKDFHDTYLDNQTEKIFESLLDKFQPDIIHYLHLMHHSINLINIAASKNIKQILTINDFWLQTRLFNRITKSGKLYKNYSIREDAIELSKELNSGLKIDTPISLKEFYKTQDKKIFIKVVLNKIINRNLGKIKNCFNLRKYKKLIKERNNHIKKALKKIDLLIFPTVFLYQEFSNWGLQTKKAIISEHGIDINLFKNFKKKPSNKIRFVFIGAIIPAKGLDILLKAWKKINDKNVELQIYGDFNLDKKYSGSLKPFLLNQKNIKLKGTFKPQDIAKVFSEIDVLILPSRWFENGPLILRNALLSKTPIIATRLGSNPEYIRDDYNGWLFENENFEDLANKISYIIENGKMIKAMSSNIQKEKSIKEDVHNLTNYYKKLINHE